MPSMSLSRLAAKTKTVFQARLDASGPYKQNSVDDSSLGARSAELLKLLGENDRVVVGLAGMTKYERDNFGVKQSTLMFLRALSERTEVVLAIFGSPYALKFFDDFPTVIMAYEADAMVQDIVAQAIFGAISFKGRLPVTASLEFPLNHGIMLRSLGRLGYSIP